MLWYSGTFFLTSDSRTCTFGLAENKIVNGLTSDGLTELVMPCHLLWVSSEKLSMAQLFSIDSELAGTRNA